MKNNLIKGLHLVFIAALTLVLTQGFSPARTALAQEVTPVSDLSITLVSVPKHARACDVFQAIFTVTNLGPDRVGTMDMGVHIPDAYHDIALLGVPYGLDAGETATFSAVIWVGSFEPGETRNAWVGVGVSAYVNGIDVDPNPENNVARMEMTIKGKPVKTCLPRD